MITLLKPRASGEPIVHKTQKKTPDAEPLYPKNFDAEAMLIIKKKIHDESSIVPDELGWMPHDESTPRSEFSWNARDISSSFCFLAISSRNCA